MSPKTRGRPRNTLVGPVSSGRWDAGNRRHRLLLWSEDLPEDADPELQEAQSRYRIAFQGGGGWSVWEARWFERRVRELGGA